MAVLVTGGAGYIGTHTCVELLTAGYEVIVVDNLSNSKEIAVNRVKKITGRDFKLYKTDLLDYTGLETIFKKENIESVIHFAALKSPTESVSLPLRYYHNNLTGTFNLCEVMAKYKVRNLVFSSSAAIYGDPHSVPIYEDFPVSAPNPYGRTKQMTEDILRDLYHADKEWNIALLRYFNPIGAHISGTIGEDPNGIPCNLVPIITQVAVGKLERLKITGKDYDTIDGTGIRDYLHVVDLAKGHLKALEKLASDHIGIREYNLGTGRGYSVLQMIETFSKVTGIEIPYIITERRPGDIAVSYANTDRAKAELGWVAEKSLEEMFTDSWRWQSMNPKGYEENS